MNCTSKTKTFSFFEETLKCKIHCEIANFFCLCKQKLCSKCVTEGVHLNQHLNVMIMPTKELRKLYINELEELESIIEEMSEKTNFACHQESRIPKNMARFDMQEIKHFSQEFFRFFKRFYVNFLRNLFLDERKIFFEIKAHMDSVNKSSQQFKCEEILDFVTKSKILKERAIQSLINKYEKVNEIQGILINRSEELESELGRFLNKFFMTKDSDFDYLSRNNKFSEESKFGKAEENKERENETLSDAEDNSFLKILSSNINKIINESDNQPIDSKLNSLNNNSYCEEIKKIINSRKSRKNSQIKSNRYKIHEKTFSEDEIIIQRSLSKNISSFDRQGESEFENPEEGYLYTLHNDSDKDFSYDKKSQFSQYNNFMESTTAITNRNRIQNLIQKKNRFDSKSFSEAFNFQKKKNILYNNYSTTKNYNNLNQVEKSSNQITPTSVNQTGYKISTEEKMCVECLLPYTPSKTNPSWKKRCLECQKIFGSKIIGKPKDITNNQFSYKAGKTNQICQSCKISFIVPVSLSKQRKTCYYCFKAGKSQKEN